MKSVLYLFVTSTILLLGCTKDKVKVVAPPKLTKYQIISGDYKVYDTLGVFLYEMSIEHINGVDSLGNNVDSLHFNNLDNQFNLVTIQDGNACYSSNDILLGDHFDKDKFNKRWEIMGLSNCTYNVSVNNVIKLRFHKCNILFYIEDYTSYFDEIIYQVAVKQN